MGESEIHKMCKDMISFLDDNVIKKASTDEDKAFVAKMKAEQLLTLAHISKEEDREKATNRALEAYEGAKEMASKLPATNPVRLGVASNYAILLNDLSKFQEAIKMAHEALHGAVVDLDSLPEDQKRQCTAILNILHDNMH